MERTADDLAAVIRAQSEAVLAKLAPEQWKRGDNHADQLRRALEGRAWRASRSDLGQRVEGLDELLEVGTVADSLARGTVARSGLRPAGLSEEPTRLRRRQR